MRFASSSESWLGLGLRLSAMNPMSPFLFRFALPAEDSGFVASRTSGSALNALTVSSIGVLNFDAVIFLPLGARRTTGLVPLACDGKRADSRSVAAWLSVPGNVRLSLTSVPADFAHDPSARRMTSQTPRTIQRRLTQKPPSRYSKPVMPSLLLQPSHLLRDGSVARPYPAPARRGIFLSQPALSELPPRSHRRAAGSSPCPFPPLSAGPAPSPSRRPRSTSSSRSWTRRRRSSAACAGCTATCRPSFRSPGGSRSP